MCAVILPACLNEWLGGCSMEFFMRLVHLRLPILALMIWGFGFPTSHAAPDPAVLSGIVRDIVALKEPGFDANSPLKPGLAQNIRLAARDESMRARVTGLLCGVLTGESTPAARAFASRQLRLFADASAIDRLAPLLSQDEIGDYAQWALQGIADDGVDRAFANAVREAGEARRDQLVAGLGQRGYASSVVVLRGLLEDSDSNVSEAAAVALANVGSDAAWDALQEKIGALSGDTQNAARRALAVHASEMPPFDAGDEDALRYAARQHAAIAAYESGDESVVVELANAALASDSNADWTTLTAVLAHAPAAEALAAIRAAYDSLSPIRKTMALGVFARQGDTTIFPWVRDGLASEYPVLRRAAMQAVAQVGDASLAPALVNIAAGKTSASDRLVAFARLELQLLPGDNVDETLLSLVDSAEPIVQRELLRALSARLAVVALPKMLAFAQDDDTELRREAIRGVAAVGTPETIPQILRLLKDAENPRDRNQIQFALRSTLALIPSEQDRVARLRSASEAAESSSERAAYLELMGDLGGASAVPILKTAFLEGDGEVRTTAIRSLASSEADGILEILLELVADTEPGETREYALEAVLLALGREAAGMEMSELVSFTERLMPLLDAPWQSKRLLGTLGSTKRPEVLPLVGGFLSEEAVRPEAERAIQDIAFGKASIRTSADAQNQALNIIDRDLDTAWTSAKQRGRNGVDRTGPGTAIQAAYDHAGQHAIAQ